MTGDRRVGKLPDCHGTCTRWGSAEPQRVFLCAGRIFPAEFPSAGHSDRFGIRLGMAAPFADGLPRYDLGRKDLQTGLARMNKQMISGVVPPSVAEATVMTVWPSVGSTSLGQALGRLYRITSGFGPISVGRLMLLATIPLGLMLYLSMRLPWAFRRYRLTNRRVIVERGISPKVEHYVDLDRFDAVDLVVQPGQEWYDCGDLVFRRGQIETLRLQGVSRPEPFRQTCLKVRQSYVGVAALQPEPAGAA